MRTEESRRISCALSATASTSLDFHFMRLGSGGGSPTIHKTWPRLPGSRHLPHAGTRKLSGHDDLFNRLGVQATALARPHSRPAPGPESKAKILAGATFATCVGQIRYKDSRV